MRAVRDLFHSTGVIISGQRLRTPYLLLAHIGKALARICSLLDGCAQRTRGGTPPGPHGRIIRKVLTERRPNVLAGMGLPRYVAVGLFPILNVNQFHASATNESRVFAGVGRERHRWGASCIAHAHRQPLPSRSSLPRLLVGDEALGILSGVFAHLWRYAGSFGDINSQSVRNTNWHSNRSRGCRAGDPINRSQRLRAAGRSKSSNRQPPRAAGHSRSGNHQLPRAGGRSRSCHRKPWSVAGRSRSSNRQPTRAAGECFEHAGQAIPPAWKPSSSKSSRRLLRLVR